MKVYIGPYRKHYTVSSLEERWLSFHHGVDSFHVDETMYKPFDRVVMTLLDGVQWVLNNTINRFNEFRGQRVRVHIDPYDTWNVDLTLSHVILPLLEQLRDTSNSYPIVDPADVPTELKPTKDELDRYKKDGSLDDKAEARWHWVMNEMIFAFESMTDDSWEDRFFSLNEDGSVSSDRKGFDKYNERINHGLRLFGKYYRSLWD
jgi:hypothetical protein